MCASCASIGRSLVLPVRPALIFVRPRTHRPPFFSVQAQNLGARDAGTPLNGTSGHDGRRYLREAVWMFLANSTATANLRAV